MPAQDVDRLAQPFVRFSGVGNRRLGLRALRTIAPISTETRRLAA